ncbi:uncharacterized protein LOC107029973 [Solanum pennellii]|uniref:Uncharacterized protein LOC107029973 n=1 Tax=Solanum pennellii TaxID=28526 RepID=A0ABM1HKS4_SOLPN|nr:uncharacterized protein LOC107029973 [Solanum pennellii]
MENHWAAVNRILRYLQHTQYHRIHIPCSSNLLLQAFTDSDWAGCIDDRKTTGGYAIYLDAALVSWFLVLEETTPVSRSSTESECKALANAVAELTWIQSLLSELGVWHHLVCLEYLVSVTHVMDFNFKIEWTLNWNSIK